MDVENGGTPIPITAASPPRQGDDQLDARAVLDNHISRNNKGIITIQNGNDTLCLVRALVVSKAICDVKREPGCMDVNTFSHIKKGRNIQKHKAEDLCRDAGVNLLKGGGLTDLKQFQTYLAEYKITVFRERWGRQVLYEGPTPPKSSFKGYLDLYFRDEKQNHFDVIPSLTAAFKCGYFCRECRVAFNTKNKYKCESACKKCYAKAVCSGGLSVACKDCGRWFKNQMSFNNHKRPGFCRGHMSVCDVKKVCEKEQNIHTGVMKHFVEYARPIVLLAISVI
uniref:C2H2-type domain-containing protein n=1 Tax=Timema poppense TaxID=170557 RepID=A0A7R9H873_TIMPO|nr:unnamed protein product [Timema poppensis]